ncbi:MAG TPA: glycosyltransferase family 4 protein [Gemmatimonadales bacterium]|nr:glycosyltransferase family 4 protein [Gemmatimonadales bacterium]
MSPRTGGQAGSSPRPRLLFVVNDAPFFLSHRLPLAVGALEAGYEVHVATPDHPRRREIESAGLRFHPISMTRSSARPIAELGTLFALRRLYRSLRPDLVHHVTHKPVLYGSLAARMAGVPAVVNAVSGLGYAFVAEGARAAVRRELMLRLYRVAFGHPRSAVIFQNQDDVALFQSVGAVREDQVVLIPGSGVDLTQFQPTSEPVGTPVVTLAARMLWDKGVGDFVQAVRILAGRGVGIRARLVGEPDPGNPRSVSVEQLSAWAREGVVEWLGYRADMPRVLAESNVICLPSCYREGVPKILLEAAAAGRPIVTTDVPGCRDVVRDGDNGFVVPPRRPEALADALEVLLRDAGLRTRFGARGRERAVAEFGLGAVVATTLTVYERLLSAAEASRAEAAA